jgi:hypothetical protein
MGPVALGLLIIGLLLPVLRGTGVVSWPWSIVLAPFTLAGVLSVCATIVVLLDSHTRSLWSRLRGSASDPAAVTPPPDHLDPPLAAEEIGEGILVEYPELLAALCHGFRMKQMVPGMFGKPLTDPWGVYQEAVVASATELDILRFVARRHTDAYVGNGLKVIGRKPSDAQVMKAAVDHFRRCAQKISSGRGNPDCPFEHVVVIFGTRSPNRDAHLKSVAPKVRELLERQYPQLATARLSDGSQVKFAEWRKQAARDKASLDRLQKDHDRQGQDLAGVREELTQALARIEALAEANESHRREVRAAARAEQEAATAELRAAHERAVLDQARQLQRAGSEIERLSASVDVLTAERDSMEKHLLSVASEDDDAGPAARADLTGIRVLLVGGETRQVAPLREELEASGAQLVHEDGVNAGEHVAHVHVVVFWIRYLGHPTYFAVRQKVRALQVPHCYWTRTSPASLVSLVSAARMQSG